MPNTDIATPARTALITLALGLASGLVLGGCGAARTTFAVHPAAAPAFDRTGSDPKAVEIADRVIAAAGGQDKWAAAKQIRWSESVASGDAGKPPVTLEEAWDRWNGRHHLQLHTPAREIIVMRGLYDGRGAAFGGAGGGMQKLTKEETDHAVADARERWEFDATTLLISFLLESPGVKLALVGEVPGEAGQPPLDEIKVSFDSRDQTRSLTYHVMVNRSTNQIERVEIVRAGDPDTKRVGYKLASWVEVGGMKLATVFQNVAFAGAVTRYSDITVSGEPDERLYVPVAQ